jgi:hypothetical protein
VSRPVSAREVLLWEVRRRRAAQHFAGSVYDACEAYERTGDVATLKRLAWAVLASAQVHADAGYQAESRRVNRALLLHRLHLRQARSRRDDA